MKSLLRTCLIGLVLIGVLSFNPITALAQSEQPVVRAILFYSPACGYCHQVITVDLPPLIEKYGQQLKIVGINIQTVEGYELYQTALEQFQVPEARIGVPALFIGETHLIGAVEIPEQLPVLIEQGLSQGGINWPNIPGLDKVLTDLETQKQTQQSPSQVQNPALPAANNTSKGMLGRFQNDPAANTIAVIVLLGMVASLVTVGIGFSRPLPARSRWPVWAIPVLALLGMGVAGYLYFVESNQVEAVCGPVGDCNSVQQSPYATLFGVLPVGLLGLIGYALLLLTWAAQMFGPKNLRGWAALAVWGMALFGTLFSIYLTFLEPFVIGATCMWCISSAIIQTLIFWAATDPARKALQAEEDDEDELTVIDSAPVGSE
jgi:uncharacterized membrane protein